MTLERQSSSLLASFAAARISASCARSVPVNKVRLSRVSASSVRKYSTTAEASRVSAYSPARTMPAPSTRTSMRCSRRRWIAWVARFLGFSAPGSTTSQICSNRSMSTSSSNDASAALLARR
jgi:hypothetical protein